jgi:hypothetical protein
VPRRWIAFGQLWSRVLFLLPDGVVQLYVRDFSGSRPGKRVKLIIGKDRRMLRFTLAVLTAALSATTAAAQERSPSPRSEGELVVTYTVLGRFGTPSADPLSLPTDLVERLAAEPHLARLEIGPRGGSTLTATFVFPDHERFRAWYASPAARDLLRLLATRLAEPLYRLDVLRASMARYLRPNPDG